MSCTPWADEVELTESHYSEALNSHQSGLCLCDKEGDEKALAEVFSCQDIRRFRGRNKHSGPYLGFFRCIDILFHFLLFLWILFLIDVFADKDG